MERRAILKLIGAGIGTASFGAAPVLAQAQGAFQLAVMPNLSARIILTNYRPMREYLQSELGRPVEIVTATDLREFYTRTLAGTYDLVIMAANLARVAELDAKFELLGGLEPPIPALFVTRKDAPMATYEALRGKALALANPQSLVALTAKATLAASGLGAEREYRTVWARNEDSLGQLLASGEAPMASMSMGEFRALREELRQTLEFREFAKVPNFFALAGKPMAAADSARLRTLLYAFSETELGKEFQSLSGVQRIRAVPPADLDGLDATLAETRAALRS
jgi:phosphonate transport system substrate-binding protein